MKMDRDFPRYFFFFFYHSILCVETDNWTNTVYIILFGLARLDGNCLAMISVMFHVQYDSIMIYNLKIFAIK